MDVVLLVFNIVVVFGLALRQPWSVYVLFAGILLLQFVPYTVFRDQFVVEPGDNKTLNGLMATEALLLAVYAALICWQGHGGGI